MKKILTTLLVALVSFSFFATSSVAQDHTFALGDSAFLLDGKPFQIISGELHYTRIPEAYWKDRLHKAKAMGLNAVSIYCMWNAHEPERGVWDFSGRQDVRHFVELAQEEKDWATWNFTQWFVKEQIEEETIAMDLLDMLKIAGGPDASDESLFYLDKTIGNQEDEADIARTANVENPQ